MRAKKYGPGRIALCINDQYICVAPYQQFCMTDLSWKSGCDLSIGDCLYGEGCVQAIEFSPDPCVYYALSTEENAFFIYPDMYVHNSDFATITAGGLSLAAGAIEVLNPVTILIGIVVPLTVYALNYYMTNVETAGAGSINALEKTRTYYDTTRRTLYSLYQGLVQMKNNLPLFTSSDQLGVFTLSSDLLSWGQFTAFNLDSLISAAGEAALSLVEQEKLMRLRDLELEKLQQSIYDIHQQI